MLEVVAFLSLSLCVVAMATLSLWVGLQVYNEITIKKLNNAVVQALAEGTYRNSYRYRPRGAKK